MASLYKNGDYYYISINFEGKRTVKSLGTKDKKVAKALKPFVETSILQELTGFKESSLDLPFSELVSRFLKASHPWAPATYEMNRYILTAHLDGKVLPTNPTSRAIHIRHINQCWNWGLKNKLIKKAHIIPGNTKGESRDRVYTECELNLMFTSIKDDSFNAFVRFAYYTGARSGEIRSISRDNMLENSLVARGKSGRRIVKLNSQAKEIIHGQEVLWNYNKDYVSHKFKKEIRKLGIKNARFHDLRRTFGLNLIKQGMSIYKVSKLLGHKSVRTTEQHYAPLLTVDIEDFEL
jgi:integrase